VRWSLWATLACQVTKLNSRARHPVNRYWPEDAHRVGLHLRLGLASDNGHEVDHFFTPQSLWSAWVKCAYASLPASARTSKSTRNFFVSTDDQQVKVLVASQIRKEEGPAIAALNLQSMFSENEIHYLGGGNLVSTLPTPQDKWLHSLGLVVLEFQSGSRLSMFAGAAARKSCGQLQAALLEMLALSKSDTMVNSHLSTFTSYPSTLANESSVHVVTRDGDCFPAVTSEPLSDAGELFSERADCYSARKHYLHSWSRPRRQLSREPRQG